MKWRHLSLHPLQLLVVAFELDIKKDWAWKLLTTRQVGKSLFFRNSTGLRSLRWFCILLPEGRDLSPNVKESSISLCRLICLLAGNRIIFCAALTISCRCADVGSLQWRQNPVWKPKQLRSGRRHQYRISLVQAPAGLREYLPDHESLLERGQ